MKKNKSIYGDLQKKVISIAEDYADLISKEIDESGRMNLFENGRYHEINDGIRILNHFSSVL